jgi:lactoylglutathione lyase
MTVTFGYTIFYVENVAATMRFFSDAFGLEQRFVTPEGDYGELETGATTLSFVSNHLADSNLAAAGGFERISAERKPVGASITLLTDDVAAVFAVALDAGAQRYVEPMVKPWGQTVAYLRDLNGILIELATPMVA